MWLACQCPFRPFQNSQPNSTCCIVYYILRTKPYDEKQLCPAITFRIRHISINHAHKNRLAPPAASFSGKEFVKTCVVFGTTALLRCVQLSWQEAVGQIGGLKVENHIGHPGMDAPGIPHRADVQDPEPGRRPADLTEEGHEAAAVPIREGHVVNARAGVVPHVPPSFSRGVLAHRHHMWQKVRIKHKPNMPAPLRKHRDQKRKMCQKLCVCFSQCENQIYANGSSLAHSQPTGNGEPNDTNHFCRSNIIPPTAS